MFGDQRGQGSSAMEIDPSSTLDQLQSTSSSVLDQSQAVYEVQGVTYATNPNSFRRLAVRRRHSLQKDEEESCRSTLAATADETLSQPLSKFLKPDSPGEASCDMALDFSATRRLNQLPDNESPIERLPDELISSV